MKLQMINELIKISDVLDKLGLTEDANYIDKVITASSQVSLSQLEVLTGKDLTDTLKESLVFDLIVEPKDDGNILRAIPKIHTKWTDGLYLGKSSNFPALQELLNK